MSKIDYGLIYKEIRAELNGNTSRIVTIQSWSVALAFGVAALTIEKLTSEPGFFAFVGNNIEVAALVIAGGAFLNFALWYITQELSKAIIRIGFYLYCIELKTGLERGWEQFVWIRETHGIRSRCNMVLSDVIFWISISYSITEIILLVNHFSTMNVITTAITVIFTAIGMSIRMSIGSYRIKTYQKLKPLFSEDRKWDEEIEQYYGHSNIERTFFDA